MGFCLLLIDRFFSRLSLRQFTLYLLGLFIGYLMGKVVISVLNISLTFIPYFFQNPSLELFKLFVLLICCYLGVITTVRASEDVCISLPFIKLNATESKEKPLIPDYNALCDGRLVDLAYTGLLNNKLIIPRFILKQLQKEDEEENPLARRGLETIRKLESLPFLGLIYDDNNFSEEQDSFQKVIHTARLLDGDIVTADPNQLQERTADGPLIINLHTLSKALKPLMQRGEYLKIKIQRLGKEENQGVGYLDDGTMVVINGGGIHIGETIKTRVLSVKHTSSGRMVFCNVADE